MYSLPKNVYRERIDFSKIKTTIPIPSPNCSAPSRGRAAGQALT